MLITRRSMLTGAVNTLDIDVTDEQMADFQSGTKVQDAFPSLAAPLREFILSGITPEEWNTHMIDPDEA